MKTAVIYQEIPERLNLFVFNGDYSHLDGVYINGSGDMKKEDLLHDIIYHQQFKEEPGYKNPVATKEEFEQAIIDGAELIVCGFIL